MRRNPPFRRHARYGYPVEIFMMGEDAKLAGQREYRRNLQTLAECLNNDEWPAIKTLSLPRWAKENANA